MFGNRAARFGIAAATVPLMLTLMACGSDNDSSESSSTSTTSSAPAMSSPSAMMAAGETFGAGCAAVPKEGAGSFDGMSKDPVATAASNNPALSTLVSAVQAAGLAETLNNAKDVTVFAPTNEAFAKIPAADLQAVLANKEMLTKILTYHVVGQPITPDNLGTAGPFTTLEGSPLTVSGSGTDFTVGTAGAKVVCGNVKTSNATVYIIDGVLMPPTN